MFLLLSNEFNCRLPSPLHVRDDIGDGICQNLDILKPHTSAETQTKRDKTKV